MTALELFNAAVTASAGPKAMATLRANVATAETALQNARRDHKAALAEDEDLKAQTAAVTNTHDKNRRDLAAIKRDLGPAYLDAMRRGKSDELNPLLQRRLLLVEQLDVLNDVRAHLDREVFKLQVKRLRAEIDFESRVRDYVYASALKDLVEVNEALQKLVAVDAGVSMDVGSNSKANVYARDLNERDVHLAELREQLTVANAAAKHAIEQETL